MNFFEEMPGVEELKNQVETLFKGEEVRQRMQEKAKSLSVETIASLELNEEGEVKDIPALQTILHDFAIQLSRENQSVSMDTWQNFIQSCPSQWKSSFEAVSSKTFQETILKELQKSTQEVAEAIKQNSKPEVLGAGFDALVKISGALGLGGVAYYGFKSLYSKFFSDDSEKTVDPPVLSGVLLATSLGAYLGKDKINDFLLDKKVDLQADNLKKIQAHLSNGEFMQAFDQITNDSWTKEVQVIAKKEKLEKLLVCNFAEVPVKDILKEHDSLYEKTKGLATTKAKEALDVLGVDMGNQLVQTGVSMYLGREVNLTDTQTLVKYIKSKSTLYDLESEPQLTLRGLMTKDYQSRAL